MGKLSDFLQYDNVQFEAKKRLSQGTGFLMSLLKCAILIGICYIILAPVIMIVTNSFFSENDVYNQVAMLIPVEGTTETYQTVIGRMDYWQTLSYTLLYIGTLSVIQVFICAMTGYGFARFQFPGKKLLFMGVILTIVIPSHTIMLPMYMTFRNFDVFGIIQAITGKPVNLLGKLTPMYIVTLFGQGLRSGLYIFIFNQYFRSMPKELEEAARIDGAGAVRVFFRIMFPNAVPSIITVTVFSLVWQYNDTFYARVFAVPSKYLMSMKIQSLGSAISNLDNIIDPLVNQVYVYAGVVLTLIPLVILYIVLQKQFVEGVERSGIVG